MSAKKMGRPKVENPVSITVTVRIDAITKKALDDYCKLHDVSKGEAIRNGIQLLQNENNGNAANLRN